MGLCTAWALASRSVEVTLYEQGPLPNPTCSSHDAHRLIRSAYGKELGYGLMVQQAWRAWDRLWADLGESHYVETGTLALATGEPGWTHDSLGSLRQLGLPHSTLSPGETSERFPWLNTSDTEWALWLDSGGALLASSILEGLASFLQNTGVDLRPNTPVLGIDPASASVDLEGGRNTFDQLVIAAGPWTGRLRPELRPRITPSRQVLAYVEPPSQLAEAWADAPMILDVGSAGFYAVPPVAGTGLKIGDHTFSLEGDPDGPRCAGEEEVRAVFETARDRFIGFEDYAISGGKVCFYTVEPNERFVLDHWDRAWGLSGLSGHGFKFAPLLGEGLAAGILGERSAEDLGAWAAGRQGPG